MGEKSKTGNAWVNFILIFVMGAIFAIGFFKVPPAMGSLMEYFQCGLSEAGWFMSACSVAGTVIAFATGAIQTKIGPKGMLIAALVCMALDSLVGVLAPNVEVFIASRFIGGLGNGFLATAGPTLIALLFKDPAKRGLPNSIWACWTAAGSLIMLNSYAFILGATGSWQGVWWVCLAIVVIGLLLTVFCIRIDHAEEMAMVAAGGDVKPWAGLTSLNSWLLVIVFACFAFIFSVWSAMAPTYLQTPLVGMDMAAANSVSSITTITGIGPTLGAYILSEIGDISRFSSAAKLAAYAGIDPTMRQSGEYNGVRNRMSKRGSPYLRHAIWLAASSAVLHDPALKLYFQKKRDEGKPYMASVGMPAGRWFPSFTLLCGTTRPIHLTSQMRFRLDKL